MTSAQYCLSHRRYCKCGDETPEEEQKERKKALLLALCNLDAHLMKTATAFVAGPSPSVTDAFLLPALYHIQVRRIKPWLPPRWKP